jgi:VanZ family protein
MNGTQNKFGKGFCLLSRLHRPFLVFMYYSPFLTVCMIIYYLSSLSYPPVPRFFMFPYSDKLLHAVAFFGVGSAAALGAGLRRDIINLRTYLEAWILAISYALVDEIHQIFTPHRTASSSDWLADAFGSALGIGLFFCLVFYLKRLQAYKR